MLCSGTFFSDFGGLIGFKNGDFLLTQIECGSHIEYNVRQALF